MTVVPLHSPVGTITRDIADMHRVGDIAGIACVVIRANGDIRTLFGFNDGQKFPMVAGCAMLQDALLRFVNENAGRAGENDGRT